ncbi:MAG: hypothetical protein ACLSHX_17910 [Suilimivivens sp.]
MKIQKEFLYYGASEYKVPSVVFACKSMLERGKAYIIKAGTIILVCNMVVQIMATFTPGFVGGSRRQFRFHSCDDCISSCGITYSVVGFAKLAISRSSNSQVLSQGKCRWYTCNSILHY